jgi:hypothetical protein
MGPFVHLEPTHPEAREPNHERHLRRYGVLAETVGDEDDWEDIARPRNQQHEEV